MLYAYFNRILELVSVFEELVTIMYYLVVVDLYRQETSNYLYKELLHIMYKNALT